MKRSMHILSFAMIVMAILAAIEYLVWILVTSNPPSFISARMSGSLLDVCPIPIILGMEVSGVLLYKKTAQPRFKAPEKSRLHLIRETSTVRIQSNGSEAQ